MAQKPLMERLTDWMRGRNGSDELGTFALALSIVILLINAFTGLRWLSAIALALALYSCWRMSSKQVAQRQAENRAFVEKLGPLASWMRNPSSAASEARTYKHLTCPSCHQRVRVPRGKGRIRVTCPSCHEKFEARS